MSLSTQERFEAGEWVYREEILDADTNTVAVYIDGELIDERPLGSLHRPPEEPEPEERD